MKTRCVALPLLLLLITLQVKAQMSETYSFVGLNRSIQDANWAGLSDIHSLTSAVNQVTGVRVKLSVVGEYNGDLYCYLRHITSAATNFCVLLNRVGRSAALPLGYAHGGLDVTFDDLAANGNGHTYQTVTNPPAGVALMGRWHADGGRVDPDQVLDTSPVTTALSAFDGTDANGDWTLFIADADGGGTNMLAGWELEVTGRTFYHGVDLSDPVQALADSDGDAVPNLLEFAVGADPTNSCDAELGMNAWVAEDAGARYLAFRFKQRVAAAALGLQYVPEVSGDHETWASDSSHVPTVSVTPDLDGQFNWVAVRDSTPINVAAPRFIRLRVAQNSNQTASNPWIGAASFVQGNGGSGSKVSLFSMLMANPTEYAGIVSSLGLATLTDTNALWTDGQFNGTNGRFFLEFVSGWSADITNTVATSQTLNLSDDLRAVVEPGESYRIRRHLTVGTVFGPTNSASLYSGLNPSTADNVLLQIPETQQVLTLFYSTLSTLPGWRNSTYGTAANQVIYPEQAVMVRRKLGTDLNLYFVGVLKNGAMVCPVFPGYNLVGTLKSLTSVKVRDLNLYTGNPLTGIAGGLNPTTADNLQFIEADGAVTTLFFYSTAQEWRDTKYQSAGDRLISPGSAFFLWRKSPRSAFNWLIPGE